jgi:hypothetical protein
VGGTAAAAAAGAISLGGGGSSSSPGLQRASSVSALLMSPSTSGGSPSTAGAGGSSGDAPTGLDRSFSGGGGAGSVTEALVAQLANLQADAQVGAGYRRQWSQLVVAAWGFHPLQVRSDPSLLDPPAQARRDAWAAQRASLQARASAAETALEAADADARRAEVAAADAAATATSLRTELAALRSSKARSDAEVALYAGQVRARGAFAA